MVITAAMYEAKTYHAFLCQTTVGTVPSSSYWKNRFFMCSETVTRLKGCTLALFRRARATRSKSSWTHLKMFPMLRGRSSSLIETRKCWREGRIYVPFGVDLASSPSLCLLKEQCQGCKWCLTKTHQYTVVLHGFIIKDDVQLLEAWERAIKKVKQKNLVVTVLDI